MEFKVGATVRFVNGTEEGIITKIISDEEVMVDLEDGLDVPVFKDELVVVSQIPLTEVKPVEEKVRKEAKPKKVEVKSEQIDSEDERLTLCFESNEEGVELYFYNGQTLDVAAYIFEKINGAYRLLIDEKIKANSFKDLGFVNLVDSSGLMVEVVWLGSNSAYKRSPIQKLIKLKKSRFFKEDAFNYCRILKRNVLKEVVFEEENLAKKIDVTRISEFKIEEIEGALKVSKKHKVHHQLEIDIHIENLLDRYEHLTNGEIVEVQMKAVQHKLDEALRKNCRELVVIHGVGKGTLRQEVRNLAKQLGYKCSDGSYQKYGAGATLIEFN